MFRVRGLLFATLCLSLLVVTFADGPVWLGVLFGGVILAESVWFFWDLRRRSKETPL